MRLELWLCGLLKVDMVVVAVVELPLFSQDIDDMILS